MTVKGMFSIVRAGFILPQPLVELALKQFPSALGTVLQLNDGTPELSVSYYDKDEVPSVEDFMAAQESNKDVLKAFWFGKSDKPLSSESMQPFEIILKDNKPVVVALIAGDYEKWMDDDDKKTGDSDSYFMANGILKPKLSKIYTKMCDSDTMKLFNELQGSDEDKSNEADINALAQHRGCVGLIFDHGDWLVFDVKNSDYVIQGDWGYSTDRLGWNPDAKAKTEEKPSLVAKAKGFLREKVSDALALNEKASIDRANKTDTKIPDTADTGDTSKEMSKFYPPRYKTLKENEHGIAIQCPDDLVTKEDRRTWHEMWTEKDDKGQIISGYKNIKNAPYGKANQAFLDWKSGKSKSFKDMKTAGVEGAERKPVPTTPIITPEKRKTLAAYINSGEAKAKAESGQTLNATELKAPNTVPLFTAQMAEDVVTLEETFRWDSEYLTEIGKRDLNALVLYAMECRHELMRLMVSEGAHAPSANANDRTSTVKADDPPATTVTPKRKSFARG